MTPATLRLTRDRDVLAQLRFDMRCANDHLDMENARDLFRALSAALVAPCGECNGSGRQNPDDFPKDMLLENGHWSVCSYSTGSHRTCPVCKCPSCNGSGEGMSVAEAMVFGARGIGWEQSEQPHHVIVKRGGHAAYDTAARLLREVTDGR